MKKKTLILIILITLTPSLVAATDTALALQNHLDYIWNLVAGALIFFMKSRSII